MKKIDSFLNSLLFLTLKYKIFLGYFRLLEVIETPTKPQFQPSSMPWNKVWVNILSWAAVMERPDFLNETKTRYYEFSKKITCTKIVSREIQITKDNETKSDSLEV